MNKSFSERFEPILILIILAFIMLITYVSNISAFMFIPIISVFTIYFKDKLNIYISFLLITYFGLLQYFSGNSVSIAFTIIPVALIILAIYLTTIKYQMSYRAIFWTITIILTLSSSFYFLYYMKANSFTLADLSGKIKRWYLDNLDLQGYSLSLDKSQLNSIINQVNAIDKNSVLNLVISMISFTSIMGSYVGMYLYRKFKLDKNEVIPETTNFRVSAITSVILVVIMLLSKLLENRVGIISNITFTFSKTTFSVLSLLVMYSLITYFFKNKFKARRYFISTVIIIFIAASISEVIMILDAVLDFRNLSGKSIFGYIRFKMRRKEE